MEETPRDRFVRWTIGEAVDQAANDGRFRRPPERLYDLLDLPTDPSDELTVDVPVTGNDGALLTARVQASLSTRSEAWEHWSSHVAEVLPADEPGPLRAKLEAELAEVRRSREAARDAAAPLPEPRVPEAVNEAAALDAFADRLAEGFPDVRDRLRAAAVPSVRLVASSGDASGRSYLGGLPPLPAGVEWPRSTTGAPHMFLARIDLAEVPRVGAAASLPRDGTLLFFADRYYAGMDLGDEEMGLVAVLHVGADTPVTLAAAPAELPDDQAPDRVPVDLVASASVDLESLDLSEAESDALWERHEEDEPYHRLTGIPDGVQWDPREEVDDDEDADWVLLLQLDSGPPIGDWGDVGRLYVLLRREDLEAGRFDRARAVMQSH